MSTILYCTSDSVKSRIAARFRTACLTRSGEVRQLLKSGFGGCSCASRRQLKVSQLLPYRQLLLVRREEWGSQAAQSEPASEPVWHARSYAAEVYLILLRFS